MEQPIGIHVQSLKKDSAYQFINYSVQFTTVKIYISKITFWNQTKIVTTFPDQFFLIDLLDSAQTIQLPFKHKSASVTAVTFTIGIDSATHMRGAMPGNLDPSRGMYWTWQTGYIHAKFEGEIFEKDVQEEFQLHLGGYSDSTKSYQEISRKIEKKNSYVLRLNMPKIAGEIMQLKNKTIMSPCKESTSFMRIIANNLLFE